MTFCTQCGHEVPDNARFCPDCDTAVALATEPPSTSDQQSEESAATHEPEAPLVQPSRPQDGGIPRDVRTMAMLCHLSAFVGLIGVPFGNILGPLLVWLLKRDESPFIDANGKESLNFQISLIIYAIIGAILILVVVGILLLSALFLFGVITVIVASIRAANGETFRYPLTIRLLK